MDTIGRYEILRKLGEGYLGELYLALDPDLGRDVALQVLAKEIVQNPKRRERSLVEARRAAELRHPSITSVYEVGEEGSHGFIAFEFLEGRILSEVLAERRLTPTEVLDTALGLADALAYGHGHGMIHRELTSANVMMPADEEEAGQPKLMHYGLAKLKDLARRKGRGESSAITMSDTIFGTPSAMSPEQTKGEKIDEVSEVFSFGSLLYELAAGEPAFTGRSPVYVFEAVMSGQPRPLGEVRPDLGSDFIAVVEKAMQKDRDARYAAMSDLTAALRRCERPRAGESPPASHGGGVRLAVRVGLVLVALTLLAFLVRLLVGGE